MKTQSVEYRPEDRAKQISLLLEQIESLRTKNLKPIEPNTPYYIFALCKNNHVIGSTNETTPEFVSKVSPNITKAIDSKLEGFGPLLLIQHNKIQQDLQPNYKQESTEHYYLLKDLGAFDNRKQKKKQAIQTNNSKQDLQSTNVEQQLQSTNVEQPLQTNNSKQDLQSTNVEQTLQTNNVEQQIQSTNVETNVEEETKNIVELNIAWNNDKPYITTPINAFSNSNASWETLLYNITRELNTNDTAFLDYTTNAPNGNLQQLNHVFCDNILLYYYIQQNLIEQCPALQSYITKQQERGKEEFELRDSNVLSELGDILSEHTSKIVRVFRKLGIPTNKPQLKPTKAIWESGSIRQLVKVSLADAPLKNVLRLVCDKETIYTLQEEGLYINDIDITQDFTGTFNKTQLIQYLVEQDKRFQVEGCSKHREYTIMDNDCSVGASCLTFLYNDPLTEQTIRYKYYNKFVQSMESAGVRETVGNHMLDWISNPEQVLKESISKCLDTGLLRLEITFYMEGIQVMEERYIEKHMDWLQKLIPPSLIYHQPISKQWELYASTITSNLCLVDVDNNKALFSYAINSLTGKVNGFYLSNTNSNKLSNLLKQYT